jgi:hypothetical protein
MAEPHDRLTPAGWLALPVHPVLVAAYPVVFLFGQNAIQQMTLAPLWLPLGVAMLTAIPITIIGRLVSGEWRRGALLASLALALFFSFGHAWNVLGPMLGQRRWLVLVYAVLAIGGAALILLVRGRWTIGVTRGLNLIAAAGILVNAVPLVAFAATPDATEAAAPAADVAVRLDVGADDPRPDIYFIILDRYPSAETLREIYGYDNTPFLEALADRGFSIADDSWAAYWKTAFSILSTLQMDHLDGAALIEADGPRDSPTFNPVFRALQGHLAVPASLKAIGYQYVHIGSWWKPTSTNADADRAPTFSENGEFASALLATTALSLLTPNGRITGDDESVNDPAFARGTTLFAFDQLEAARDLPGPTYVFAHLLVPHPPYVFNPDGSEPTADEIAARTDDEQMLRQMEWANTRVLQVLDHLLDVPPGQEPIIALEADEGPWPDRFIADQHGFPWLEARPDEIQEKFGILNALHLPGVDPASVGFTDDVSPVNTFRIIFNAAFGTDLPLLENTTYLSPDYERMYDFVPYDREAMAPAP